MPPSGGPGGQFASQTLGGLLSVQEQPPSASDVASELMSQADTNGDGQLSADEIQQALGGGSGSSDLSSAIAKLDTNGDGQLSTDELTSALQSAQKAHHHHHHRGGAEGASAAASTTASATTTASTATASTTAADTGSDAEAATLAA